jgi:hypothetical protein
MGSKCSRRLGPQQKAQPLCYVEAVRGKSNEKIWGSKQELTGGGAAGSEDCPWGWAIQEEQSRLGGGVGGRMGDRRALAMTSS